MYPRIFFGHTLQNREGLIPASVIDEDQFILIFRAFCHDFTKCVIQKRKGFFFVIAGNHQADQHVITSSKLKYLYIQYTTCSIG